jgi:mRNA interferase HigB
MSYGSTSSVVPVGVSHRCKAAYPKASILKAGRVVFNIKGNDYRLVTRIQYQAGVVAVRFFGSHTEYDRIDAESV